MLLHFAQVDYDTGFVALQERVCGKAEVRAGIKMEGRTGRDSNRTEIILRSFSLKELSRAVPLRERSSMLACCAKSLPATSASGAAMTSLQGKPKGECQKNHCLNNLSSCLRCRVLLEHESGTTAASSRRTECASCVDDGTKVQ
jgi:hypothetical protein